MAMNRIMQWDNKMGMLGSRALTDLLYFPEEACRNNLPVGEGTDAAGVVGNPHRRTTTSAHSGAGDD